MLRDHQVPGTPVDGSNQLLPTSGVTFGINKNRKLERNPTQESNRNFFSEVVNHQGPKQSTLAYKNDSPTRRNVAK